MKDFYIDLTEEFKCIGGKCPHTCCRGWQIPVDSETYGRYLAIPGNRGKLMRGAIKNGSPKVIRKILGNCPFFTRDRLCRHQKNNQEFLMPVICRNFPRHVADFGEFREGTLELACPVTAKLFYENPGRRKFIMAKEPQISVWELDNYDQEFLSYLVKDREYILDYLWEDRELSDAWYSIYAYIYNKQDLMSKNLMEEAQNTEITDDKELQGRFARENAGYCFYPIRVVDKMIIEELDAGTMILKSPSFYHLMRRYLHYFSKKGVQEADLFFDKKVREMIESQKELYDLFRSYFSYLIQQEYLNCYETYSPLKEVTLVILYTQLLMLFFLVEYLDKGKIPKERGQRILYLCEHNIRHNPSLMKNLYSLIRQEIL